MIAERTIVRRERATDDGTIARKQGNAVHIAIWTGTGVKGRIQRTVGICAGNPAALGSVIRGEVAHHDGLIVRLNGQTIDFTVRARVAHLRRHRRMNGQHVVAVIGIVIFIHGTSRRMIVIVKNGHRGAIHHASGNRVPIGIQFIKTDGKVLVKLLKAIVIDGKGNGLGIGIPSTPSYGAVIAARKFEIRDQSLNPGIIHRGRRSVIRARLEREFAVSQIGAIVGEVIIVDAPINGRRSR